MVVDLLLRSTFPSWVTDNKFEIIINILLKKIIIYYRII